MTARELRNRRRAEERKARKSEPKQLDPQNTSPIPIPSHHDLGVSPETLEEFGPEFIAHANAIRERVHHNAAQRLALPSGAPAGPGRSTGPRTPTGKTTSCRNSFKHGLASGQVVIPGEDPAAFEALCSDLLGEHAPANSTEELLVHEMAQSYWLMQRATRLQNTCFSEGQADSKQLTLFLRYRTTYERAFHKAFDTLLKLKKERAKAPRQFVSQNSPKQPRRVDEAAFLSEPKIQKDEAAFLSGPRTASLEPSEPKTQKDEAAFLSEPKTQREFVWQNGPAGVTFNDDFPLEARESA